MLKFAPKRSALIKTGIILIELLVISVIFYLIAPDGFRYLYKEIRYRSQKYVYSHFKKHKKDAISERITAPHYKNYAAYWPAILENKDSYYNIITDGTLAPHQIHKYDVEFGNPGPIAILCDGNAKFSMAFIDPNGIRYDSSTVKRNLYQSGKFGDKQYAASLSLEGKLPAGKWIVEIGNQDVNDQELKYSLSVISIKVIARLELSTKRQRYNVGDSIKISTKLTENSRPVTEAAVMANINRMSSFRSRHVADKSILKLFDDGSHGDRAAGDGWYTNLMDGTAKSGRYQISAIAEKAGTDWNVVTAKGEIFIIQNHVARLNTYGDCGIDTNKDDIFDCLGARAFVEIEKPGRFIIGVDTRYPGDSIGISAQTAQMDTILTRGTEEYTLLFDGKSLFQKYTGTLYLYNYTVEHRGDADTELLYYDDHCRGTKEYSINDFIDYGVILTGVLKDTILDVNNDGFFDSLEVSFEVEVGKRGNYYWRCSLIGDNGEPFLTSGNWGRLLRGKHLVKTSFSGRQLLAYKIDGPYKISDIEISNEKKQTNVVSHTKYNSNPYRYVDFK
jgi:hypothetical protein